MFDDDEMGFAEGIASDAGLFESPLVAWKSGVERRLLGRLSARVQSLSCDLRRCPFCANGRIISA